MLPLIVKIIGSLFLAITILAIAQKSLESKRKITFITKAEDKCLSVACGSLISRYIFIKEMDKLSKKLGKEIPKGAGDKVDEFGKEIIKKYGKDILKEIAKLNFKNTDKILKKETK